MNILIATFLGLLLASCAPFQDSTFSDMLLTKELSLNTRAISKIKDVEADGVIRIAILADVHQNYSALDKVIYLVNQTAAVDFVVNLGDFTNSGYNLEYDQYIDAYTSLRHPALTVIGNHDSVGAGPKLFRKAFSDLNYWFESDTKRYIFFNSANWENPEGFDPQWLKDTVASSTKSVFIFTHVSLQDAERYAGTPALQTLADVVSDPKVLLVLNGHNHVYSQTTASGTVLLQSERAEGTSWLLLEIRGTQLTIKNMADDSSAVLTLKN